MAGTTQSDGARRSSMPLADVTSPAVSSPPSGCCPRTLLSPSWQGGGKVFGLEDVLRCARTRGDRPGQYLCQVAAYPVGFTADLDGDVAAFGDEAVVDGGLMEHGGTVSLQLAARRTIAAYGLRAHDHPRRVAAVFASPCGSVGAGQPDVGAQAVPGIRQATLGERFRHPADGSGALVFRLCPPHRGAAESPVARRRLGHMSSYAASMNCACGRRSAEESAISPRTACTRQNA